MWASAGTVQGGSAPDPCCTVASSVYTTFYSHAFSQQDCWCPCFGHPEAVLSSKAGGLKASAAAWQHCRCALVRVKGNDRPPPCYRCFILLSVSISRHETAGGVHNLPFQAGRARTQSHGRFNAHPSTKVHAGASARNCTRSSYAQAQWSTRCFNAPPINRNMTVAPETHSSPLLSSPPAAFGPQLGCVHRRHLTRAMQGSYHPLLLLHPAACRSPCWPATLLPDGGHLPVCQAAIPCCAA